MDKDGVPVLAPCSGRYSQLTYLCQPLEPVPETAHMRPAFTGNSKGICSCVGKPSGEMWGQEVWGTDGALHRLQSKYPITKYPPSAGIRAMS